MGLVRYVAVGKRARLHGEPRPERSIGPSDGVIEPFPATGRTSNVVSCVGWFGCSVRTAMQIRFVPRSEKKRCPACEQTTGRTSAIRKPPRPMTGRTLPLGSCTCEMSPCEPRKYERPLESNGSMQIHNPQRASELTRIAPRSILLTSPVHCVTNRRFPTSSETTRLI